MKIMPSIKKMKAVYNAVKNIVNKIRAFTKGMNWTFMLVDQGMNWKKIWEKKLHTIYLPLLPWPMITKNIWFVHGSVILFSYVFMLKWCAVPWASTNSIKMKLIS